MRVLDELTAFVDWLMQALDHADATRRQLQLDLERERVDHARTRELAARALRERGEMSARLDELQVFIAASALGDG